MTRNTAHTELQTRVLIQDFCGTISTFFLVAIRIYVRVIHRYGLKNFFTRRAWRAADVLVVLAWLCTFYRSYYDGWWNLQHPDIWEDWTYYNQVTAMKMQFAQRVLSCMPLFLVKLSLLCFFAEFVPKVLVKTWWSIRIAMFVVVSCMIATEVMVIFSCDPISSQWIVEVGKNCMPSFWEAGVKSWMAMQLGTDVLVLVIPFLILPRLENVTRKQKVSAGVMFALGLLSVICSALTAWTLLMPMADPSISIFMRVEINSIASLAEVTMAIMIACIPSLKFVICRWWPWQSKKEASWKANDEEAASNANGLDEYNMPDGDDATLVAREGLVSRDGHDLATLNSHVRSSSMASGEKAIMNLESTYSRH